MTQTQPDLEQLTVSLKEPFARRLGLSNRDIDALRHAPAAAETLWAVLRAQRLADKELYLRYEQEPWYSSEAALGKSPIGDTDAVLLLAGAMRELGGYAQLVALLDPAQARNASAGATNLAALQIAATSVQRIVAEETRVLQAGMIKRYDAADPGSAFDTVLRTVHEDPDRLRQHTATSVKRQRYLTDVEIAEDAVRPHLNRRVPTGKGSYARFGLSSSPAWHAYVDFRERMAERWIARAWS